VGIMHGYVEMVLKGYAIDVIERDKECVCVLWVACVYVVYVCGDLSTERRVISMDYSLELRRIANVGPLLVHIAAMNVTVAISRKARTHTHTHTHVTT
jgi:hypothetical protein